MKRTTKELYGCSPSDFADLPYNEALFHKAELAKIRLKEVTRLLNGLGPKATYDEYSRLAYLQQDILCAIKHNEELIDELQG